jgi:hypothetical protein
MRCLEGMAGCRNRARESEQGARRGPLRVAKRPGERARSPAGRGAVSTAWAAARGRAQVGLGRAHEESLGTAEGPAVAPRQREARR